MAQTNKNYFSSTRIAVIAMLSALAGILYILDFKLPFFPSFLSFKLSDIPVLIGSFALGPISAGIIVVVQVLIKIVVKSSSTVFVGELSDILTTCAFTVIAGIIYKNHRTFKGALIGMACGTLAEIIVAILSNYLFLIPFYLNLFFKGDWNKLVKIMNAIFPNCTKENFYNYYLWLSVLPFNLLRCLVAVGVTLPVYKRISILINRINAKFTPKQTEDEGEGKSIFEILSKADIIAISVGVGVAVLLILFAALRMTEIIK